MRVEAKISSVELENERGALVPGVSATCSRCGHCTESYGEEAASIRRCLALLREECPEGERNFYVDPDGD